MSLAAGTRSCAIRQIPRVADAINLNENYYSSHAILASVSVFSIVHFFGSASISVVTTCPHADKRRRLYLCVSKVDVDANKMWRV